MHARDCMMVITMENLTEGYLDWCKQAAYDAADNEGSSEFDYFADLAEQALGAWLLLDPERTEGNELLNAARAWIAPESLDVYDEEIAVAGALLALMAWAVANNTNVEAQIRRTIGLSVSIARRMATK